MNRVYFTDRDLGKQFPRILAEAGIAVEQAADVIGLCLNPPQNALVLSVDEKPSIQAIERTRGYVQTSSGKIVQGMKSTYKRHGTINLFAALEVATGTIRGKTTQTKKRADSSTTAPTRHSSPIASSRRQSTGRTTPSAGSSSSWRRRENVAHLL